MIDELEFVRGDYPFTKEELRSVLVKKLACENDEKILFLGGDTLFTALDLANGNKELKVYIYESNESGINTIEENCRKFDIKNIEIIKKYYLDEEVKEIGFDRILVGNTIGHLEDVVDLFIRNTREESRIVFMEITIEKLAKVNRLFVNKGFDKVEVICLNISRNHHMLGLNMMQGENPVYIISVKK